MQEMRELIGRKVGMTRLFDEDGTVIPVTVVQAGPCVIVSRRTTLQDGHEALSVGYEKAKAQRLNKPMLGQFAKAGVDPLRIIVEVPVPPDFEGAPGDALTVEMFREGELVDVSGLSIGKGWQGVMKRHNFKGVNDATHGQSNRLRAPGSIGQSSYPSRVFKGMKMAGRMGGRKTTIKNLKVVTVDTAKSLLMLRGAIPGKTGALLRIKGV
jgi:large subunit ribosomal protein L3